MKSGIVTILGRPNVGKSTLINYIVGEKISIVTPKPQTTRFRILGVKNLENSQIVYIDTPGFHIAKSALNKYMVDLAIKSLEGADLVYLLVEPKDYLGKEYPEIFKVLSTAKLPVFLLINKIDIYKKEEINETKTEFTNVFEFKEVFEISALLGKGITNLLNKTIELIPEGPQYFPEGSTTDISEDLRYAEIIREKIFMTLGKELPYNTAVTINEMSERENGMLYISAYIHVAKESQKGIVIGQKGTMIKKIGILSRIEIENLARKKVFLDLQVRVEEDWPKFESKLKKLGYFYLD